MEPQGSKDPKALQDPKAPQVKKDQKGLKGEILGIQAS